MGERTSELLNAALSYAGWGWQVLPLHSPTPDAPCSCGRADCSSPGKHPRTKNGLKDATVDQAKIRQWWKTFPLANVGLLTGAASGMFVLDVDQRHGGDDSLVGLRETFGPLPQTICALTGAGEHLYFRHPGGLIQNSAGKLGEGLDVRGDGGYVVAPPSLHPSGKEYAWEGSGDPAEVRLAAPPPWLLSRLRTAPSRSLEPSANGEQRIKHPGRNVALTSMAGTMRRRGFPATAILAALSDVNEHLVDPPLDPVEIRTIANSVGRYAPGDPITGPARAAAEVVEDWPKFPDGEEGRPNSLHGLAGDVVRAIDPYTEADRAAILAHFLVFFGNCVGTAPHFRIGGHRHPAKIFVALVGDSATGRKGTSEGQVRYLFESVDLAWTQKSIRHGMASGEGLIRAFDPLDAGGNPEEPRLVVVEPEMVNVLKAMSRDGSTLSGTIRNAWDLEDLSIHRSSKKNTLRVHGVHVSMITHVTRGELLRSMDSSQTSNGFANRFLWLLVRRSKSLPDAPQVPRPILDELARRIAHALSFGAETREMFRDDTANELWRDLYGKLGAERTGLAGVVTSRGQAQVLRLALIYALLDQRPLVAPEHIRAAVALWDFTVACSSRIFGDRLGDPIAQRILEFLRDSEDGELTRTELNDALGRNYPGRAIDEALNILADAGYLVRARRPRSAGEKGRAAELFLLKGRG